VIEQFLRQNWKNVGPDSMVTVGNSPAALSAGPRMRRISAKAQDSAGFPSKI